MHLHMISYLSLRTCAKLCASALRSPIAMCLNIREGVDLAKEFASRPVEGNRATLLTAAHFK